MPCGRNFCGLRWYTPMAPMACDLNNVVRKRYAYADIFGIEFACPIRFTCISVFGIMLYHRFSGNVSSTPHRRDLKCFCMFVFLFRPNLYNTFQMVLNHIVSHYIVLSLLHIHYFIIKDMSLWIDYACLQLVGKGLLIISFSVSLFIGYAKITLLSTPHIIIPYLCPLWEVIGNLPVWLV